MRIIYLIILLLCQTMCWADTLPISTIASNLSRYIRTHQVPGAAIAIYAEGKTYFFNYGVTDLKSNTRITQNTLFEIASVTKVFTGTLLAYEADNATVRLNDPVVKYIPALADTHDLPIDRITLQMLAAYTSQLPRGEANLGASRTHPARFFNALKAWRPKAAIGQSYAYSNIGFSLLGFALSNAAQTSYVDLLNQLILMPLNMHDTYVNVPANLQAARAQGHDINNEPVSYIPPTAFQGAGEILSTSTDLIRFVKANLNQAPATTNPALLAAMKHAQQTYFQTKKKLALGLGWQKQETSIGLLIAKDGQHPGFSSYIGFVPEKQIGVVVLFNKGNQQAVKMGRIVLAILANQKGTT